MLCAKVVRHLRHLISFSAGLCAVLLDDRSSMLEVSAAVVPRSLSFASRRFLRPWSMVTVSV